MKKYLKAVFAFAMTTTMLFAMAGCGSSPEANNVEEQNTEVTQGEGTEGETTGDVFVMATNAEFPPY